MKRRDVTRGTSEPVRVRVREARRETAKLTARIALQGHGGARLLEYEQGARAQAGAGGAGQRWQAAAVARGRGGAWRGARASASCTPATRACGGVERARLGDLEHGGAGLGQRRGVNRVI